MSQSIGPKLRTYWQFLSTKPMGKWLFSRIIGWIAPYTGTIGANVVTLESGHGVVTVRESRRISNHLKSVHAIALVNLAEKVTGLTLLFSLPDNSRGILVGIQMDYHKKARGLLTAECHCEIPQTNEEKEFRVEGKICDEEGDVVASAVARWLIGPGA